MSLATRCTSCGTIFKVVQDQLKVSEGWVRCGRCQQVFNALEGLFDLERDPPPQRRTDPPASQPDAKLAPPAAPDEGVAMNASPPTATPYPGSDASPDVRRASAQDATAALAPPPFQAEEWPEVPATHEDDALDSRWLVRPARDGRSARERHARHAADSDFTDARFPSDAVLDDMDGLARSETTENEAAMGDGPRPMPAIPRAAPERTLLGPRRRHPSGEDTPAFIRRAKRQAQWRHPVVRATLSLTSLALLALLGLQSAIAFRDWIAAYQPSARPWLQALCRASGCEVGPLRRLDRLAVDSVTLVRGAESAGGFAPAYRLAVSVHNDAPVALAAPHLELSLTDANGQLVARRVLSPADLGLGGDTLAPARSTTVQAALLSAGPRIAGYTVELFYP